MAGDSREFFDGEAPRYAISPKLEVALKFHDRAAGVVAVNSVNSTGVKAEGTQAGLQIGDIIASQKRVSPIEKSITEAKTCFDEGGPGVAAHYPINTKATLTLEGLYGCFGGGAKVSRVVADGGRDKGRQAILEITDGGPCGTLGEGEVIQSRYGLSS